jgi:putative acetyltransferase
MRSVVRNIQAGDNTILAYIVRHVLEEFKANKPGTAYFESATDNLFELFQKPGSAYFVVEINEIIIGGGGIYATDDLPAGYCELVKLYLMPGSRGKGFGKLLLEKCFLFARDAGYTHIYLESMNELNMAVGIYERSGFKHIDKPLGNTGHAACGIWMVKSL